MLILGAGAAHADYGPGAYNPNLGKGDVVCVGSDTVQVITDFLADGDNQGDPGFNSQGLKYKWVSLDATADANVRVAYSVTSSADAFPTSTGFAPLAPTVYLRAGAFPAQRPNGSGSGYQAIINDVTHTATSNNTGTEKINCVRGSSLPSSNNSAAAAADGWGGLHPIRIATDNLQVAAASTTDAPAQLSRAQLLTAYTTVGITWGTLLQPTATATCPSCVIRKFLPQSGSGTRNTFLTDVFGTSTPSNIASDVNQSVEENDPTAITNAPFPADSIVPFSGDRLTLWNEPYFHNPFSPSSNVSIPNESSSSPAAAAGVSAFPGGAVKLPGITLLGTGTASDGNPGYQDDRGLFISYRDNDDNAPSWQPGSSLNWVQTLLTDPTSWVQTSGGPLIAAAAGSAANFLFDGVTPAYKDCGTNSANWATTCGNHVQ